MVGRNVSTTALLRLLESGEPEVQCAAALVLGSLKPGDRRVVPTLGRVLAQASAPVKPYVLDALGQIDDTRTFKYLFAHLTSTGSLREQAVRLLQERGVKVLGDLTRAYEKSGEAGAQAIVRVLARIPHPDAIDFLVGLLASANFELARPLAQSLRRAVPSMDGKLRRHLVSKLTDALDALTDGSNPTAEIAMVKVLGVCGDSRAVTALLSRTGPGPVASLRYDALEALAATKIPPRRHKAVVRAILLLLDDSEPPGIAAAALRVLRNLTPFPLGPQELEALVRSDHEDVARVAVRELRRFPGREVVGLLLDTLLRDSPAVQAAAAATLADVTDVLDVLVDAHEDPRFAAHRDTLRAILTARTLDLDSGSFTTRVRRLLDDVANPEALHGRILALAAVDRSALNRAVESRARQALQAHEYERVLNLLEPLVKNRLATPQGRYILALGHLGLGNGALEPGDGHHDRAMQLLSPLARVSKFRLKASLLKEDRVPATCLEAVATHMSQRPEVERDVATALRGRLG